MTVQANSNLNVGVSEILKILDSKKTKLGEIIKAEAVFGFYDKSGWSERQTACFLWDEKDREYRYFGEESLFDSIQGETSFSFKWICWAAPLVAHLESWNDEDRLIDLSRIGETPWLFKNELPFPVSFIPKGYELQEEPSWDGYWVILKV